MFGLVECGVGAKVSPQPRFPIARQASDPAPASTCVHYVRSAVRSIAPSQSPNWLNTNKG